MIPTWGTQTGVNAIFNSADFSLADITHSAIAYKGALTPNFARATEKRIPDHEGVLRTLIAGELGFPGARRVYNLISAVSEDFSNAAWTKLSVTVVTNQATAPNGTLTADLVHPTTSGTDRLVYQNGLVSSVVGNRLILEVYAKYAGIRWLWFGTLGGGTGPTTVISSFDLQNGVVGQTGTYFDSIDIEDVGDGWYRCSAVKNSLPAAPLFPIYGLADADGSTTVTANGTDGIYLWGAQLEDITGRTDQTTPSEYVSVGVESAPAYHGSMVDGVKCFPTDLDGTPLTTMTTPLIELAATNLCLQSNAFTTTWGGTATPVQNAIGPDGATSAWTFTDADGGTVSNQGQNITLTAATHTASLFVKKTTGAQSSYPVVYLYATVGNLIAIATVDTSNGVATAWSAYTGVTIATGLTTRCTSFNDDFWRIEIVFTGTATAWTYTLVPAGTTNATQSTGTVTSSVTGSAVFYGAQVELGTAATSYIPTTTVAATRDADQLYYTGADIANIKTLAAIGFKRESGFADVGFTATLTDGTTTNYVEAARLSSATVCQALGVTSSVLQWNITASNAYTPGTTSNVVTSFTTNDIKFSKDGTGQTPDTGATIPTVSRLEYGMIAGAFQLNGYPGSIYGWTRNLSQSELNAVTAA